LLSLAESSKRVSIVSARHAGDDHAPNFRRGAPGAGDKEGRMLVAVFRRRLKEGKTYQDFQEAWFPKEGFSAHFGVPGRIVNARRLDDEREILSVGFLDIPLDAVGSVLERVAGGEGRRHQRIADVIESTELRAFYEVVFDEEIT
jgi:hypothetical protein